VRELSEEVNKRYLAYLDTPRVSVNMVERRSYHVYVMGEVGKPGMISSADPVNVLQALSLAGGVTDRGSTGRIKVVRAQDGKKKELKVRLTDIVEPGDTLIVGERFF
jgi:polysaccharide export outer membrane protein